MAKKVCRIEDKYKNKESEYKNFISQKEERKLKETPLYSGGVFNKIIQFGQKKFYMILLKQFSLN